MGPRTLSTFQLVWILGGSGRWWSNHGSGELRPGRLLLVRPGTHDRWRWDEARPTTHGYAYFGLPDASSLTAARPQLHAISEDDPVPAALRYLLLLDTSTADGREVATEVLRFVLVLFARGQGPVSGGPLPAAVEAVVEHLRCVWGPSGIARPVGLAELARATALSPAHLCRIFRSRFDVGPVTAIEMLRLARAATLLTQSDLPINAIARACGFTGPDHFSRRFRRSYGAPPGRYRHSLTRPDPTAPLAGARILPLAGRLLG